MKKHNKKDDSSAPFKDSAQEFDLAMEQNAQGHYVLRLFITGMTPNSRKAIENVKRICEEHLQGSYELEIVDIYQQPIFAKEGQIVAAPTLVKELPPPLRKFIGDMSQTERILLGLDLRTKK
ncbi:circadian clock KaiB family protein [Geomonas propionica]|uniref:Circadian clock KaiB family protein n=1 Tax=Geomonas propionica TaxID=2798582 RepID=A0ABS0YLK8_9BACT|nr:circadian clock KaiB family protein [Geomonas propionica]MBJ6798786.1 circadian clock KaiB family protein [Geomonas propionica]